MNFVDINDGSVTIKIPSEHAFAWAKVFEEFIGNPIDRTKSNNGCHYKTVDGVKITLWAKTKAKSKIKTIMLNGQCVYFEFVTKDISKLYLKVKRKIERIFAR